MKVSTRREGIVVMYVCTQYTEKYSYLCVYNIRQSTPEEV